MAFRVVLGFMLVVSLLVAETPPQLRPGLEKTRPVRKADALKPATGLTGIDAKWSEFGGYLQSFIEGVQDRWYANLGNLRTPPKNGTRVAVTFAFKSDGSVGDFKIEGTAGDAGIKACVDALSGGNFFPKWSEAMVKKLGSEQKLTLSFYYR